MSDRRTTCSDDAPIAPRRLITAEAVRKIERLLAEGKPHDAIAAQCEVSSYVVGVIANDDERPRKAPRQRRKRKRRAVRERVQLDAVDVWRIQRMLSVGWLNAEEIAREVGVGGDTVLRIAAGKRPAITLVPVPLCPGEKFLAVPVRCKGCGGLISVSPCRVCAVRREKEKSF